MKYMLDTNILIYLIKNKPESVTQRVNALGEDDELCMSFVTYAELLKGAEGSTRKADVVRRLEGLIRQVPVLYPSGAGLCEHYAEQSVRLKATGTPIGSNDLWIACHALAEAAVLVTNNESEFKRVAGLTVENWV
ncbi:MAG: Ribonuclease VapC1 [Candidatus Accumulibacter adjunctus]|uniref:Ribonuclease VapC n=1 Tax=Candidatus Accumulibacter adjunctus TaxID=1454001 RepID=A0A011PU12_9PROT|nr:MAG: Ribonuclease VapC1 [Candidatus Accumulibacter adjunctus]